MRSARRTAVGAVATVARSAAWRRARRPLVVAAVYLAAWYPLDQVAQRFQTAPDISVWYPPAGLDVALLLVGGLRYAPLLVLNALLHTFVLTRRPVGVVEPLLFDLVAPLAYTMAVVLLRRVLRVDPRLRRLRDVTLFAAVAAIGAPLVVATGQVAVLAWAGLIPWGQAVERALPNWAGIATGIGMLTPPLLLLLRRWPRLWVRDPGTGGTDTGADAGHATQPQARPTWRTTLEGAGETIALALALLAAYGTPRRDARLHLRALRTAALDRGAARLWTGDGGGAGAQRRRGAAHAQPDPAEQRPCPTVRADDGHVDRSAGGGVHGGATTAGGAFGPSGPA